MIEHEPEVAGQRAALAIEVVNAANTASLLSK